MCNGKQKQARGVVQKYSRITETETGETYLEYRIRVPVGTDLLRKGTVVELIYADPHELKLREWRERLWDDGVFEIYKNRGSFVDCTVSLKGNAFKKLVKKSKRSTIAYLTGWGTAKWNPEDKDDPEWAFDLEYGKRLAKTRAIRDLAEQIVGA
jgi:hypothetical protein